MKTLRKVKIEGFKSIEHAELMLGDLNVVIGANGSGKSNLIGVFRLLERVLSHNLQVYVASEPDRLLHHGRRVTPALSLDFALDQNSYGFKLKADRDSLIFEYERVEYSGYWNYGERTVGEERARGAPVTRLLMLVEGQSEEIFVNRTLKPYLQEREVHVQPPIVLWTKRQPAGGGFRGGVSNWSQICKSLLPLLRDSDAWVTTLLGFYGLPDDVPGYAKARGPGDPRGLVAALQDDIAASLGHPRFIPFFGPAQVRGMGLQRS